MKLGAHFLPEDLPVFLESVRAAAEVGYERITLGRLRRVLAFDAERGRIEAEAGRKVSDRELERLIDQVLSTNEANA